MEIGKYKLECFLLILGVIISIVSVFFDYLSIEDTTWFARSGSIVVLMAVIVEYRLSSYIYDDIDVAVEEAVRIMSSSGRYMGRVPINKAQSPKSRSILIFISHVIIICGTVIWSYGDVLVG